ncbi:MAG: NUDIX hydrolase [Chloroflexota bacterium]
MGAKEQGADATTNRWLTIPRALCFVCHGDDVLLMKRASHRRIFPNRYNGVGGHIERDEDPLTAIVREVKEETGLDVTDIKLCGVHNIDAGAETGIIMFVFRAQARSRDFVDPGEEGTLHWIAQDSVLTLDLVEDLPLILPHVLGMQDDDAPYFAHVGYDETDTIQFNIYR